MNKLILIAEIPDTADSGCTADIIQEAVNHGYTPIKIAYQYEDGSEYDCTETYNFITPEPEAHC